MRTVSSTCPRAAARTKTSSLESREIPRICEPRPIGRGFSLSGCCALWRALLTPGFRPNGAKSNVGITSVLRRYRVGGWIGDRYGGIPRLRSVIFVNARLIPRLGGHQPDDVAGCFPQRCGLHFAAESLEVSCTHLGPHAACDKRVGASFRVPATETHKAARGENIIDVLKRRGQIGNLYGFDTHTHTSLCPPALCFWWAAPDNRARGSHVFTHTSLVTNMLNKPN